MNPDPLQVLFLWNLLAHGGEAWKSALKPDLKGRYGALRRAGLFEEERRPYPGSGRLRIWVRLSDVGWAWAQAHLDAPISLRSTASGSVLQALLGRLEAYLTLRGIALADVIRPTPVATAPSEGSLETLTEQIGSAYFKLTGGHWNVRVRLADLRQALPAVPRTILDAALLDLARGERLALYPLDDPLEIGDADRAAAIERFGQRLHLVYMDPLV